MMWIRQVALMGLMIVMSLPVMAVQARAEAPLKIVATTGMIADAARQIGGDLVDVRGLMGPGFYTEPRPLIWSRAV